MALRRQRFQLAPTKEQALILRRCEGLSRYAWNWLMRQVIASLDRHEKVDFKLLTRKGFHEHVKSEATWALELPLRPAWEALTNCQQAWFRHWKNPQKCGRPRWKAKRLTGSCHLGIFPKLSHGRICISPTKLGWIKLAHDKQDHWKPPTGAELQLATLKLHAGHYFVSVLYRFEQPTLENSNSLAIGIDLGVIEVVTVDSAGAIKRHKLPRPLKRKQRRIAILQRRLQRKSKGSKRRLTCCRKLGVQYWRIANIRRYFCHQLSHDISRRYQMIVIEDLKVSRLLQDSPRGLSRGIADAAWSSLHQMLTYKVSEMGGTLIVADQWFPSSQLCTQCGARSGPLPLNIRMPQCSCGHIEDRDVRAAKNLLNLAPHGGVLRAWRAAAPDEAPTGAGVSSN